MAGSLFCDCLPWQPFNLRKEHAWARDKCATARRASLGALGGLLFLFLFVCVSVSLLDCLSFLFHLAFCSFTFILSLETASFFRTLVCARNGGGRMLQLH